MDLPRSPVCSSFRIRVHAPVLFPASSVLHWFSSPHFLSLTGPRTCLVHRFPLPPSFIRSHISRCSSVPSRRTMCVGGAVCNDLVKQLHYTAISDIMSTSCDLCSSVIRLALRGSTDVLYLVI